MNLQRIPWSEAAERGTARSVVHLEPLRESVVAGRFELWHVDGCSYAVTETFEDVIFVHCYEGRDMRAFAAVLERIAQRNGVRRVQFESPQPHTLKLLQDFEPREISPGIFEIRIHPLYRSRAA